MVLEEFRIVIGCPTCSSPVQGWPDEMPSCNLRADTAGDAEDVAYTDLYCDECGSNFRVTIRAHMLGWDAFVADDPSISGTVDHYDYRDDDEPPPEPNSYRIFIHGMIEWRKNVSNLGEKAGGSSRNRMLFMILYSIFEAYISDRVTSVAISNRTVIERLIKDGRLKDKIFSLENIFKNPNIVRDTIRETLQGLSFHNLEKTNALCLTAFGKEILPSDRIERSTIMKSVKKLHDCVHRNGVDREGNKNSDIDQDYLLKIGNLLEKIAENLEDVAKNMPTAEEAGDR